MTWKRATEIAGVIAAICAVIGVIALFWPDDDDVATPEPSPTSSTVNSSSTTDSRSSPSTEVSAVIDPSPSAIDRTVDAVEFRTGSGQYSVDTVEMDGKRYPNSIAFSQWAMYDGGTASFNLGRKCTRLEVVMGFDDQARDGATADMYIKGDDRTLRAASYAFGDRSQPVVVDVTDILRLEIGGTYDMNGNGADGPAAGSPKLACVSG